MEKDLRLVDQIRNVIRTKHYTLCTEKTYLAWIKQFIIFHRLRHPRDMGVNEIETFLSNLAVDKHVAAFTQNQAFNAILFLYRDVLHLNLDARINAIRAKRPQRMPVVMTHAEVDKVLGRGASINSVIG